jgi:ferritin-like metal-binding protein YciE
MKMATLKDLFVEELKDLYSAEKQLIKALPKMAKAATSEDLKEGFLEHLEQTKGHAERLEQVFELLGQKPRAKTCKAMEGLIEEGKELLEEDAESEVLDAGLIAAAQRVEHYEIAGYGCVRTYAELLGEDEARELLQQTLDEEAETDKKLTQLAEQINVEAEGAGDEESEEEMQRGNGHSQSKKHGRRHATAKSR